MLACFGGDKHACFGSFIQNTHGQRKGDKPKLNGNARCAKQRLNAGDFCDENRNGERNHHAQNEPRVAPLLRDGIGLHDAQPAVAHCQNVPPLQDHQGDKVDALPDGVEMRQLILRVAVEAIRVLFKGKEQAADGDARLLPVVEEEHGVRGDGLHEAREEVGLDVDLKRDEMVPLVVSGGQGQQVELLALHDEGKREEQVGEDADDDHEERAQRERHAEEDVDQHRPDLRPRPGGEQVRNHLLEILEHQPAPADGLDDGVESVEQHQVRRLDGNIAAGDNGDANIGRSEGRRVVDTVAGDGNDIVALAELFDDAQLLLRRGSGKDDFSVLADHVPVFWHQVAQILALEQQAVSLARLSSISELRGGNRLVAFDGVDGVGIALTAENTSVAGNSGGSQAVVAGDHEESGAGTSTFGHCMCGFGSSRIDDAKNSNNGEILSGPKSDLVTEGIGAHGVLRSKGLLAKNNDTFGVARELVLDIRRALDENLVFARGTIAVCFLAVQREHPLVLGVEGDLGQTRHDGRAKVAAIGGSCKPENSGIGGISLDLAAGDGHVHGCRVECGIVAVRCSCKQSGRACFGLVAVDGAVEVVQLDRSVDKRCRVDMHFVLGQGASLVGADDIDTSQGFNHIDRLHLPRHHHERQSNGHGHAFGDKGHHTAHDIVQHRNNIHKVIVVATQPAEPGEEDQKRQANSQRYNDVDKPPDFLLNQSSTFFGRSGGLGNTTHDRSGTSQDDDADTAAVHNQRAHEGNVAALQEVLVRHVNGALNLVGFASENGTVESNISRVTDETHVGRYLVADFEMNDISTNKLRGRHLFQLPVSHDQRFCWQQVGDGLHGSRCRPVLEGRETSLKHNDQNNQDSEGKIGRGRGVAQGPPADEEDNDTNPEDGTEAAKEVHQDLLEIVRLGLWQGIAAISLESVGSRALRKTR
ncbi:hypothetical protein E5D57_003962 [Metarhizium anisopliae]|nr:hypothetical protein E5D57_003962 [Metarhizium anisopliae]